MKCPILYVRERTQRAQRRRKPFPAPVVRANCRPFVSIRRGKSSTSVQLHFVRARARRMRPCRLPRERRARAAIIRILLHVMRAIAQIVRRVGGTIGAVIEVPRSSRH